MISTDRVCGFWCRCLIAIFPLAAIFLGGVAVGHYGLFPAPQLAALKRDAQRTLSGGEDILLIDDDVIDAASAMPWQDGPAALVFAGDSLTANGPWDELLPDHDVRNRGLSGDTVGGLDRRMSAILAMKPQQLVVMIGINDLILGNSERAILQRYNKMVAKLVPHTRVTLLAVLHCTSDRCTAAFNERVASLNRGISKIAARHDAEFLDFNPSFARSSRLRAELTVDGIHLNAKGYRLWRTLLLPRLISSPAGDI